MKKSIALPKKFLVLLFVNVIVLGLYSRDHLNSTDKTPFINGKSYALLIGINKYNTHAFTPLQKPEGEVKELEKILESQGYFVSVLTGSDATRANVLAALDGLCKKTDTDRVLVYFTGHGFPIDFIGITDIHYFTKEVFLHNNSVNKDSTDFLILGLYQPDKNRITDAIGLHEIADKLMAANVLQRILICDACFSGAFTPSEFMAVPMYSYKKNDDGFFSLTGIKARVYDGATFPVIKMALNGVADTCLAGNRDGFVSAYELAVFTDNMMRNKYAIENGVNYKMRYFLAGSGEIKIAKHSLKGKR